MKTTYKNIILKILRENPDKKFKTWDFQRVSTKFGWVGASGDRRLRELKEEGRVIHDELSSEWRYKPSEYEIFDRNMKSESNSKLFREMA